MEIIKNKQTDLGIKQAKAQITDNTSTLVLAIVKASKRIKSSQGRKGLITKQCFLFRFMI